MNGIEAALIGKIGKDAELRTSQAGKPWTAINVAVGKDDDTSWVRVTLFGDMAIEMAQKLKKGASVYVEARDLRIDAYTTQTGEQRHGLNCIASKIELVGVSAIGRNRSPKQKPPPEGASPAPFSTVGNKEQAARRDWQRPADAELIPF